MKEVIEPSATLQRTADPDLHLLKLSHYMEHMNFNTSITVS